MTTAVQTEAYRGYLWGAAMVAACMGGLWLAAPALRLSDLLLFSVLSVAAISSRFPIGPSLFTAALSAIAFDFFFIPPVFAFVPSEPRHVITLMVFVVVAAIISGLGEQARRAHVAARDRQIEVESERLRNSLLSAVSHDMRTPLASILGAGTELVRDGRDLPSEVRQVLAETIVDEAERLDQIVANLLDFARLDSGSLQVRKRPEALDETVEAALGRVRGRIGARSLQSRVPADIPMLPMDSVLVQQVLVNLLENALRYSPEHAPVELEAMTDGSVVAVEVRDRGAGVREDEIERLFQRFYRGTSSSRRDGGVGLGLTICRAIIAAHGGTIALSNREGGGAIARFTLPMEKGKADL